MSGCLTRSTADNVITALDEYRANVQMMIQEGKDPDSKELYEQLLENIDSSMKNVSGVVCPI